MRCTSLIPDGGFGCHSRTYGTNSRVNAVCVVCYRYLVKFLARLAQDSDVNKMSPSNISIVLGPNLLWAKTEGCVDS